MAAPYISSRSPPPLIHPRPAHISQPPPEAPSSQSSPYSPPGRVSMDGGGSRSSFDAVRKSSEGYVRYSSPPVHSITGNQTQGGNGGFGMGDMPQQQSHPQGLGMNAPSLGTGFQTYGAQPILSYPMGGPSNLQNPYGQPFGGFGGLGAGPGGPGGVMNMGMGIGGVGTGQQQWPMGVNDATAQMGMQLGRSAVAAGQDYVEKNFTRFLPLPLLKTSFSVTNSYVLNKLRLVLFPWRHRPWSRKVLRRGHGGGGGVDGNGADGGPGSAGQVDGWMPPRDDINAPDLYIPTMALVTYTLLAALTSGLGGRFHPEVLGVSLSKALGVVILEFMTIKLGTYLLDVRGSGASGVELIGYGGYKFVGIIVTILASFLNLGKAFTGSVFLYTFCANAFFLLRSLKYVLLPDPSTSSSVATITHGQRSRRVQFLFVVAMAQIVFMGALARV